MEDYLLLILVGFIAGIINVLLVVVLF